MKSDPIFTSRFGGRAVEKNRFAGYGRMDVSQGGGPQQQAQAHQPLPLVEPPAVAAVAAAAAQAAQAHQNQVQQGPSHPQALAPGPQLAGPSQANQQQQPIIQVGAGVVPAPSPQPVVVGPIPQPQGSSAINGAAAVIQPPQVCKNTKMHVFAFLFIAILIVNQNKHSTTSVISIIYFNAIGTSSTAATTSA